MVIYADVILFINFFMDFFILWICGKLLNRRARLWRLFCGGALGATLYVLPILLLNRPFGGFAASELIIASGLFAAFGRLPFAAFFNLMVLANISSFAVGGVCMALFYAFGGNAGGLYVVPDPGAFPLRLLLCASAVSYIALKLFVNRIKKRTLSRQEYCRLEISAGGRKAVMTALIDTGSSLCEPISGVPVIVAEKNGLSPMLEGLPELYDRDGEVILSVLSALNGSILDNRLRIVPFSGLGKKDGLLIGMRTDYAGLFLSNGGHVVIKQAIIGIYDGSLSAGGLFRALVNPDILNNGEA
jgi:stage II sporulation protein GA (sporulation sigma-E factor processing peptidase)